MSQWGLISIIRRSAVTHRFLQRKDNALGETNAQIVHFGSRAHRRDRRFMLALSSQANAQPYGGGMMGGRYGAGVMG